MTNKKEMTAPCVSVGADTEQSFQKCSNNSITENVENINTFEEIQCEMWREADPSYLKTVTLNELYEATYMDNPSVIDTLLYPGTYLFVGSPKVGKSFLMAQLAYHVSTGTSLWNYDTRKGTVLYLALEDRYNRLQKRMYRMVGGAGNSNLHFAISSNKLGAGLNEQIARFLEEHPDTRLVIIDTLKKVLEGADDSYSYANDYEVITQLKSFSDSHNICLLVVHHTRKQTASDIFEMISGTNGLLGAADGAFVLYKEKRTSNGATLEVVGRDQPDQKFQLKRDVEKLSWNLDKVEAELWKEPSESLLELIAEKITTDNLSWEGTPTALTEWLAVDMKPNALSLKLNINASRLLNEYGILYKSSRSHDGRKIKLALQTPEA